MEALPFLVWNGFHARVRVGIARRQLTDDQKAILGRKIEADIAKRARLRQKEHGKTAPGKHSVTSVTQCSQRTTDEVAATVGLGSGRTYKRKREALGEIVAR